MKKQLLVSIYFLISTCAFSQWIDSNYSFNLSFGKSVKVIDKSTVIILGSYNPTILNSIGKIYRSTNNGLSFSQVFTGAYQMSGVYFWNSQNGIAVGGEGNPSYDMVIAKTNNGGLTWTSVTSDLLIEGNDVFFVNENVGFIAGDGGLLKTTDGGNSWNSIKGIYENVKKISFPSANIGYACLSDGSLFKSSDGGDTWVNISSNLNYNYSLQSVYFLSDLVGFVIPFSGSEIFRTADGGITWTTLNLSDAGSIYDIKFVDDNIGYIAGEYTFGSIIMRTKDRGLTWTKVRSTSSVFSYYGFDVKDNFMVAAGLGGFSRTNTLNSGDVSGIYDTSFDLIKIQNPTSKSFSIDCNEKIKGVTLINNLGKKEQFESKEINTSFSGVVLINIQLESSFVSRRVLIK
jgi:photosystem II stability/assembly factor-like uncharacterized protein